MRRISALEKKGTSLPEECELPYFRGFRHQNTGNDKKERGEGKKQILKHSSYGRVHLPIFRFFFLCFYIFSKNLSTLLDGERKCYCKSSISKLIVYLARCRAEALWHQGREKKEKQKGEEQGHSR